MMKERESEALLGLAFSLFHHLSDDDDVYYYICWRLKLAGETENIYF